MGKSNTPQYTSLDDLVPKIQKIVDSYRDQVLGAIGDSVKEGAEIFVKEAQALSPVDTGEYKNSWKVKTMKRAKFVQYIGNTKKVKAHYTDSQPSIPLINILEFSTRLNKDNQPVARPVVAKAINNSKDQIFNLIVSKIQKGGNNA